MKIQLNKLVPGGAINARSNSKVGADDLADSIHQHGLLQPLLVRSIGDGKFQIIAGNRRLNAIRYLVRHKLWEKDRPVPCTEVQADDATAVELSLVENIDRVPLHEVDQFVSFRRMVEQGMTIETICQKFAVNEKFVNQRLALARIAPVILEAWRSGQIEYESVESFTLTDSQDLQERIFTKLQPEPYGLARHRIRSEITRELTPGLSNGRLNAIGLEAYQAAGGMVRSDLFSESFYILNPDILDQLFNERLEQEKAKYLADGWSFVALSENRVGADYYEQIEPVFTDEEAAQYKLYQESRKGKDWSKFSDLMTELRTVAFARTITDEVKARTGVVLHLERDGTFRADHGMYQPEGGEPEDTGDQASIEQREPEQKPEANPFDVSAALSQRVSECRTAALAASVAENQTLALTVLLTTLTMSYAVGPCQIRGGSGLGCGPFADKYPQFTGSVIADFAKTFGIIQDMARSERLELLAAIVARSLNNTDNAGARSQSHHDATKLIADQLEDFPFQARKHFNAVDYFTGAPKSAALEALKQMGASPDKNSKKSALAAMAADLATRHGWLPPQMVF